MLSPALAFWHHSQSGTAMMPANILACKVAYIHLSTCTPAYVHCRGGIIGLVSQNEGVGVNFQFIDNSSKGMIKTALE
jgi:hypothetical protein